MNARNRIILTAVAAFLVVLLAYFLLIRPRQSELAQVKEDVQAEENLTQEYRAQLQNLRALQANAPKLQAELDRIRKLVPQDHEVANFIFQVNAAANASGVELTQLTNDLPKQPPEGAALAQVRITIGGEGGYFAIQDFVRRLYSLDRALRIDLLDLIAVETGTGGVRMTATARIFFEAPSAVTGIAPTTPTAPVQPAPPPPSAAPDPAASPTAAATP